jgi:hypothetical protein
MMDSSVLTVFIAKIRIGTLISPCLIFKVCAFNPDNMKALASQIIKIGTVESQMKIWQKLCLSFLANHKLKCLIQ